MLGFVKHKIPDYLLGVITQCQRNSHCIYATASQARRPDNSNHLEFVQYQGHSQPPRDISGSLQVCRCLHSMHANDQRQFKDDNPTDLKSWLPSAVFMTSSPLGEKNLTLSSSHECSIKSCRVYIHENTVRRRNIDDLPDVLSNDRRLRKVPEPGSNANAVVNLLLAENDLIEIRWSRLMSVGLDQNSLRSLRSLNFADCRQRSLHSENVGVILLCHFFDRNAFRYGELASRQMFFKSGNPTLNGERGDVPSMDKNLPSSDQLRVVQDYLPDNMSRLFLSNHDYSVYVADVVLENNWYWGISYTTVGRLMYMLEVAKLRLFVHLRLANIRVQLLKTTSQPVDGTVCARWRVSGIPQSRAIMFWNFFPWNKKRHSVANDSVWLDGYSIFSVNRQGLIYKHKMDRVMPDEDRDVKASVVEGKLDEITAPAAS